MDGIRVAQRRESIPWSEGVQEFASSGEERSRPAAELRQKRRGRNDQIPVGDKCLGERRRFECPHFEPSKERARRDALPDGCRVQWRAKELPQALDSGEFHENAAKVEEQ